MMAAMALGAMALGELPPPAEGDQEPMGFGRIPVEPHLYGAWPFTGFPQQVSINGVTYVKARYRLPMSGVVEQYRENVATNAQHLCVYRDGSFLVNHRDEVNPRSFSTWLQHAAVDAPGLLTKTLALVGFGIGLVGGLLLLEDS
jgi:hypothetical protein